MPTVTHSQGKSQVSCTKDLLQTRIHEVPEAPAERKNLQAFLTVLSGPEAGRSYRLSEGTNRIGRSDDMDLVLPEEGVSRIHTEVLVFMDGSVWVRDCSSTNGTLVDGVALEGPLCLEDGARLQIGSHVVLKLAFRDPLEERVQEELYASAVRDPLTGLYNRRYFEERMAQEWSYSRRHAVPLSVLMFDLDHFKRVNDTLGHDAGDAVLRKVSEALARAGRSEEVLARVGGEEFAVLMLGSDETQAAGCAERVRLLIEGLVVRHASKTIPVTASLGVASTCVDDCASGRELLCRADERLYSAKRSGRNRVVACDAG